jgi:DNA-binding response OmpR family regulator
MASDPPSAYAKPSAAGSSAEALEELKRNPYDVIVLDICMPGMDGLTSFLSYFSREIFVDMA